MAAASSSMPKIVAAPAYISLGVWYVLKTPSIWKKIFCPLLLAMLISFVLTIVLFAAAMKPQADALIQAGVASGWAWFLAVMFTFFESVILTILAVVIVFGTLRQQIFDKTYESKRSAAASGNIMAANEGRSCMKRCAQECKSCGRLQLVRLTLAIVTFPLNFVPILGTVLWSYINGFLYAWDLFSDYFVLNGVTSFHDQKSITSKDPFFHSFGFPALMLETIPIVGVFFLFSNAAGAGLYAAAHEPALRKRPSAADGIRMGDQRSDVDQV